MSVVGKVVTAPAPRKGFGELFGEAKGKLDNLQKDLASIFPAMPGQNVAKYYDLAIGIDFHETIFPPMPLLPVPHIGMVFDIMSAVMSAIASVVPPPPPPPADGSSPPTSLSGICKAIVHSMKPTVQVHGQWVANAGTGIQHLPGIFVHIPFPIVKPMASSEMWMGSSTVLADGGPCSTQFHPALSCNLIGIPAPFRITKPKPKVALMAPTSMLLIITSGGAPVLVGGPPTIDLFQLAMQLGLKGMGKLWGKKADDVKIKSQDPPKAKSGMGSPPKNKSKFVGKKIKEIDAKRSTGGKSPFDTIGKDGYRGGVENIKAGTRTIDEAKFTKENIEKVEAHLTKDQISNNGELWENNKVMVDRLKAIEKGELSPTPTDKAFLTHELRESELMEQGKSYEAAHAQTCKEYGFDTNAEKASPHPFYTPEADQALYEADLKRMGF